MLPWLLRLLGRCGPREGWIILILAWGAVLSLPGAAVEGALIIGLQPTLWLATLGLLIGWWLAHQRRLAGWLAAPLTVAAGIVADLAWGVNVLNVIPLFGQTRRWLDWLWSCGGAPACHLPAPAAPYFVEQWAAVARFGQRVSWWTGGAAAGQGVADNLVLVGVAALIAWLVAAWAGWWIARRGQPFAALLPTGMLLTWHTYTADTGYSWLLLFLGATTALLVLQRFYWLTRGWEISNTDYSPEVRLEVAGVGIVLTALVVILSPTVPFLTPQQISEAFWRTFGQPYQQVEQQLGQSFPGIEGGRSLIPPAGAAAGGLPRAHLLGGRPELGREIALRVWLRGARPDALPYWRGQTFAHYTGRGWDESATGHAAAAEPVFAAGAAWDETVPQSAGLPDRYPVLSAVEVVAASRSVLYAAGEPVSADRPYVATVRAPGELIALAAADRADRYTVLGQVAGHDATLLRAAGRIYPAQVISLYLSLPPDLPPQLAAYTAEITRGAQTPYDAALAIETALRKREYTLNVPMPPAGRELTSWFLFDLGKGYCDYFATTMAVLARLAGIPSRLAIGYTTGTFDPRTGGYVVTELQAHSWPELYFPGYGWIPFEPTPALPTGERHATAGLPLRQVGTMGRGPEDLDAGLTELRGLATIEAAATARIIWVGRLLGLMCGLLLCWVVGRLGGRWLLRRSALTGGSAGEWYDRLAGWGSRLGRPLRPADTPAEYAAAVTRVADRKAAAARWARQDATAAAGVVGRQAPQLAAAFAQAIYGPRAEDSLEPSDPPAPGPLPRSQTWPRLWAALRRLWLVR